MFETLRDNWNDYMEVPEIRWIVWGTLLVVAVLVAVYFSKLFRDLAFGGSGTDETELLSDLDSIKSSGYVYDEEFERMKSKVVEKTKAEQPAQED